MIHVAPFNTMWYKCLGPLKTELHGFSMFIKFRNINVHSVELLFLPISFIPGCKIHSV